MGRAQYDPRYDDAPGTQGGYGGSYGRFAAFVRAWKLERQQEAQTVNRQAKGTPDRHPKGIPLY